MIDFQYIKLWFLKWFNPAAVTEELDQYQESIKRFEFAAKLTTRCYTDTRRMECPALRIMDHIALFDQANYALENDEVFAPIITMYTIRVCDWYRTGARYVSIPDYVDIDLTRRVLCQVAIQFMENYRKKEPQITPGVVAYNMRKLALLAENTINLSYVLDEG